MSPRCGIGVMCRDLVPGYGKTRLRGHFDGELVDQLQRAMLSDTLTALDLVAAHDRSVFVAAAPGIEASASLPGLLPAGWTLVPQAGDDLGARILHAFITLFERGSERVLLTGSDAPALRISSDDLRSLDRDEMLLLPTTDGGYAAIALPFAEPRLFASISWSSSAVADETRAAARACGLRVRELPAIGDIDEPGDVEHHRVWLAGRGALAPATARLLCG